LVEVNGQKHESEEEIIYTIIYYFFKFMFLAIHLNQFRGIFSKVLSECLNLKY
jgi:hypothetical protein